MLTSQVLTEARTEGGHIVRIEANASSVGTVLLDCNAGRTGAGSFSSSRVASVLFAVRGRQQH